jgi:hypothetical protein
MGDCITTLNGTATFAVIHALAGDEAMYNLTLADAHTYYVGTAVALVHNTCRITLGLSDYLETFTQEVGGENFRSWGGENWRDGFFRVMNDPNNEVYFNLTGIDDVGTAITRASLGRGGATDWELYQIWQNMRYGDGDWLNRITWMRDGQVVANPFAG